MSAARHRGTEGQREMATTRPITAEELARLPDDGYRYDLIEGVLIRMSPANFEHGQLAAEFARLLGNFVRPRRLGIVVGAETGFFLARNPDVVLGPDAAFVRADRLPPREQRRQFLPLAPDLAVEIVSPSESARSVATKVAKYLQYGTRLVWVVHPRRRTVTVYAADGTVRVLREGDILDGGEVLPDFRVPVAELFS